MSNGKLIVNDGFILENNRVWSNSPSYRRPDTFKVSIDTPDVNVSDENLTVSIPISGIELVDSCYETTGWSVSGGSVSSNTAIYKPDSSTPGSLQLVKSVTSQSFVYAEKNTSSVNGTGKDLLLWFYISDDTAYDKIASTSGIELRFGSDSGNFAYKYYNRADVITGWNFFKNSITSGFSGTSGSPSLSSLDYTMIKVTSTTATDTFSDDDIIFDVISVASSGDYVKDVDSISLDETDQSVTVVSKLTVSEANGFLIDGHAHFNQDSSPLIYDKSKFDGRSKSDTDLFKVISKFRKRNIQG